MGRTVTVEPMGSSQPTYEGLKLRAAAGIGRVGVLRSQPTYEGLKRREPEHCTRWRVLFPAYL